MRSVACVALFLMAAFALPECSVSQTPPDNDTRELTHLEDMWNQAHVAGDAEALDRLWADDLEVAVPHMAVMTRAESLGFARSGRMKFVRYERIREMVWSKRRVTPQANEVQNHFYSVAAEVEGLLPS